MPVSLLWNKALQVLVTLQLSNQSLQKKQMDGFPANLRSDGEGNALWGAGLYLRSNSDAQNTTFKQRFFRVPSSASSYRF